MFTRSEIPRDPNRPPFSADERYESLDTNQRREVNGLSGEVRKVLENCKRQINGLNEDILEKEEELRILRQKHDMAEKTSVPASEVRDALLSMPHAMELLHQSITSGPELLYAQSLIDPFGAHATGIRIPSLSGEETIATYDWQTAQLVVDGNGLLVINLQATNAGPYLWVSSSQMNDFSS